MSKLLRIFLSTLAVCGLLFAAPAPQLWAGQQAQVTQGKRPATAKKTRRAPRQKPSAPETPKLTKEELLSPYSSQAELQGDRQNATRLFFEPVPEGRPFADTKKDDLGLNLRLGRERLIDPLTGEEIRTRADQAGAKGSGKSLDLKGAVDKLGGKAEVQVDLLKF